MAELKRILHVDDDEDIRVIANMALEMVGNLEVLQCGSGREATEKAADFAPDLFLLDYMMPEMDGEQTLRALRNLPGLQYVPVIFMTARVQADIADGLRREGALEVITKPFDPMELANQIREVWSSRPVVQLRKAV
jgi:CheY-like chemotaxis protein